MGSHILECDVLPIKFGWFKLQNISCFLPEVNILVIITFLLNILLHYEDRLLLIVLENCRNTFFSTPPPPVSSNISSHLIIEHHGMSDTTNRHMRAVASYPAFSNERAWYTLLTHALDCSHFSVKNQWLVNGWAWQISARQKQALIWIGLGTRLMCAVAS